jgi:hypothetical protein
VLIELAGRQGTPFVFGTRLQAGHVVGEDQDSDARARRGGGGLLDRRG